MMEKVEFWVGDIIHDLYFLLLSILCRIFKEGVLLELIVQFPSVMMKMQCQYRAQSQVLEVEKEPLHLKLQPEEGAGAGVGAKARIPAH